MQDDGDGDGEEAYVLEDIPAGSTLEGLEILCLDAFGRPVPDGTTGKLRVTGLSTKRVVLDATGRWGLSPLTVTSPAPETRM